MSWRQDSLPFLSQVNTFYANVLLAPALFKPFPGCGNGFVTPLFWKDQTKLKRILAIENEYRFSLSVRVKKGFNDLDSTSAANQLIRVALAVYRSSLSCLSTDNDCRFMSKQGALSDWLRLRGIGRRPILAWMPGSTWIRTSHRSDTNCRAGPRCLARSCEILRAHVAV